MLNLKRICLLAFVLLVCGQAPTLASGTPVALHVIAPESGFTDLDLENRLGHIISGLRGYQLIWDDNIKAWIYINAKYFHMLISPPYNPP